MDKIRRIFPLLMLFVTLSCTKTVEIRIPYRQVNLELDLRYNDKSLNALYSHKIYIKTIYPQNPQEEKPVLEGL